MQESGVDLDFDHLVDEEDNLGLHGPFYELQSKPIIGSPQTEVKHASMTNRTNLKLALMKAQLADEAKRDHRPSLDNNSYISTSSLPSASVHVPSSAPSTEVPPQILQVKSRLENPTKYYVQQSQRRQIESYLVEEMGKMPITQSLPAVINSSSAPTCNSHPNTLTGMGNSAPADPDSPLSMGMSSTATSVSEVDDILGAAFLDLESVDTTIDNDLSFIEPSLTHMSQTLPPQNSTQTYMGQLYETDEQTSQNEKSSSSCPAAVNRGGRQRQEAPPFMSNDEARMWVKERQKKDNHNLIERRRRFNINDRIKELGTLLPKKKKVPTATLR